MPLNLTTLAGKTAKVDVEFMGQSTKVLYDPIVLTQENLDNAMTGDTAFVEFFCKLVKTWDVQRSGKKVPITPNGLKDVPMLLLKAIYYRVMSDSATDTQEGK